MSDLPEDFDKQSSAQLQVKSEEGEAAIKEEPPDECFAVVGIMGNANLLDKKPSEVKFP